MKNNLQVTEPTIRNEFPYNIVTDLIELFELPKRRTGEEYSHNVEHITVEDYFATDKTTLALINEYGFEIIGFYLLLRLHMAMCEGFGINITDKSLIKIFSSISIDTDIVADKMQMFYNALLESGLLIIIKDNKGDFVTTRQQFYNWEYKNYTKYKNRIHKQKSREKKKENLNETDVSENFDKDFNVEEDLLISDTSIDLNDDDFDDLPFS